ncbi:MAG: phosphoenolpyruvate--protein phosphotransferase [Deltaproteobacteria bacterium]|jgi:phosphotransferase system enzyme I (PtsI)|nr:phosphoenolpyruvate--protein phosphotransferase [Deltaproteobacteria bacterium]
MLLPPPFVPKSSILKGIGVGTSVVAGEAYVLGTLNVVTQKLADDQAVDLEVERFLKAVDETRKAYKAAKDILPSNISNKDKEIFEIYLALLKEPFLQKHTIGVIHQQKINAEAALTQTLALIQDIMSHRVEHQDAYIQRRTDDVEQLVNSLIQTLQGQHEFTEERFPEGSIIVVRDISPAEVVALPRSRVSGLVTENGSRTSHSALLAQALKIPAVMGVVGLSALIKPGNFLILDAVEGHVIVDPDKDTRGFYEIRQLSLDFVQREIVRMAHIPARTLDDRRVEICGNLELIDDLPANISYGAEGIGLYRTEMMYLIRNTLPAEEDLYASYSRVVGATSPWPVTIRTLDLGADKMPTAMGDKYSDQNQALGLRAIRFCLKHLDIFRTQLRAILRASASGKLRIMFPMISTMEEIESAKKVLEEVREELLSEGHKLADNIPVGIMVEVPAAVILVKELGKKADFFSIGTNDLIQYSLALDRTNPEVSDLYQPLNPSILRMIKLVIDAGKELNIPVSICGGMAAYPVSAALLVGLGADMLSMPYFNIPAIKRLVRMSFMEDMQKVASEALTTTSYLEADSLVRSFLEARVPELLS